MAKNPADQAQPTYFFREWRKHRGYNQEALADMVGLTASSISQLENGKQGFSDSTLVAMAKALDCRPGDLLLWPPAEVDAATGPIREAADVQRVLARIEGLTEENVNALLAVISGFQQANASRPEPIRQDGQSERAIPRRESTPSR